VAPSQNAYNKPNHKRNPTQTVNEQAQGKKINNFVNNEGDMMQELENTY
jgi:hypothetical protein